MRTISIMLLAAAAQVESASWSTSGLPSMSANFGQHESSAQNLTGLGSTNEERMPLMRVKEGATLVEPTATNINSLVAKAKSIGDKLVHHPLSRFIGLGPSRADRSLVDMGFLDLENPASVTSSDFIFWYEFVKRATPRFRNPVNAMVRSLVRNAGYAKSARMLQAVVSEGKSTREANELLSALLTVWVQNSNSLNDVLMEQFKIGAGLDEMYKDPDLILVADRFISTFNFLKQAQYPNMLNQLTVYNGEEEVAKLVASLDRSNPLVKQWKGRQFPIWLRAGKEPTVVEELLKTDPDPTKNSAAVGICRSYKKEFERQTTGQS